MMNGMVLYRWQVRLKDVLCETEKLWVAKGIEVELDIEGQSRRKTLSSEKL
jgi:hypothetical protein